VSEKGTITISPAAGRYIGPDKPKPEKLRAAAGEVELAPPDLVLVVYYLCHDRDAEVKNAALQTFHSLQSAVIAEVLRHRELHPRVLDALAQVHGRKPELLPLFTAHPMLSEKAARYLAKLAPVEGATPVKPAAPEAKTEKTPACEASASAPAAATEEAAEEESVDESTEEFQSKYQISQAMGVGDKIKMALTGDKEWRSILIKDSNKLVSGAVVKNPRITDNEVLAIAKSQVQNEEIMRVIVANKEWVKNASIRKALIYNHKTPLPAALRYIASLSEKELSLLARSKNVSSVIAAQARRILMTKKEGR
jgi:hypothetical protein